MIICLILWGLVVAFIGFATYVDIRFHYARKQRDKYYDLLSKRSITNEQRDEYELKKSYYRDEACYWDTFHDLFAIDGGISFLWIICIILVLTVTLIPISIQQGMSSIDYDKWTAKKEALELDYQDYLSKDTYDTTDIYQRINDFNWELHMNQFWASNPWTSWYNNQKLLDIDPIEVIKK